MVGIWVFGAAAHPVGPGTRKAQATGSSRPHLITGEHVAPQGTLQHASPYGSFRHTG
jgi:hypothetical protein